MRTALLFTITLAACASSVPPDDPTAISDTTTAPPPPLSPPSLSTPPPAPPGTAPPPPPSSKTTCDPGTGSSLPAPNEQWAWVPDPQMKCGNGTPTGFAINKTTRSTRLLVFLMGGGGCFDASTCSGADPNRKAAHLDGYDVSTFSQDLSMLGAGTIFDRNAPQNPFKDDSWIFVPYCTGDFHVGSTVASYGISHAGWTNMGRVLESVVPTFCPAVDRVILMGSSAGGFGAVLNYARVATAFDPVRVDLVDDCGPTMPASVMTIQPTMRAAWGAAANAPSDCPACASDWNAYFPYLSSKYTSARLSLLASTHDVSICPYFGSGLQDPTTCKWQTKALATQLAPLPNVRVWMTDEFTHVFAGQGFTSRTTLTSFLGAQIGDSPSWTSVVPP